MYPTPRAMRTIDGPLASYWFVTDLIEQSQRFVTATLAIPGAT
jgi:hypothetical protein